MTRKPTEEEISEAIHQAYATRTSRDWLQLGLSGSEWIRDHTTPSKLAAMRELYAAHTDSAERLAEYMLPFGLVITPAHDDAFEVIAMVGQVPVKLISVYPASHIDPGEDGIYLQSERSIRADYSEAIKKHFGG